MDTLSFGRCISSVAYCETRKRGLSAPPVRGLVESYRNAHNRICHRTILNVGFMEDSTVEQRQKIQSMLRDKYEMKQSIFSDPDPVVNGYVSALWQRIIEEKRLDIGTDVYRIIAKMLSNYENINDWEQLAGIKKMVVDSK